MEAGETRPDPDALLAKIESEQSEHQRGRLKIFFGYAAGVGKTYAMLSAARALEMKRGDVLAGYIEPHGRSETEALLLGLDVLPSTAIDYRGITLREFDLDAALTRKPRLILVDELAHSNAPDCRHPKRWQDVEELLDAGIDVYTTLNVQHLESLNDIVGKITGIVVRETVPDGVFERADEVELVDLPPDELLERFAEGKVYIPEQARLAADRFFKRETLVALREVALRKTAEQVNRQVELGRRGLATQPIWATRDRLLVAVGPSPTSARLIRATRRMASELRAPWYAVAVERTSSEHASPSPGSLEANLRLAERLGAEVVTLRSDHVAQAIVEFAHDRGVTRLVVGKTAQPHWKLLLRRSIVDELIKRSGDLDVLVIRGEDDWPQPPRPTSVRGIHTATNSRAWQATLISSITLASALLLGLALHAVDVSDANIVLVFLLSVAVIAYLTGPVASLTSSVVAVLLFNYFFTDPRFTLDVNDPGYLVTFGVMLIISLTISGLVGRIRAQERTAAHRAELNDVLFRVSRRLGPTAGTMQVATELQLCLAEYVGVDSAVFFPRGDSHEIGEAVGTERCIGSPRERAVAQWSLAHGADAGRDTDTLPSAEGWYVPLVARGNAILGVLGVTARDSQALSRETRQTVLSIASLAAQCLEREAMSAAARESAVEAESERLRSDLLATVSHDLRTPLATIGGAASAVLDSSRSHLDASDRDLLTDAISETNRLTRLVENLLQLSRLDDVHRELRADWFAMDELIDGALKEVSRSMDTSSVEVELPKEPILVWADASLITQVLINLIDNALRYAPRAAVMVSALQTDHGVRVEVRDAGPGFGDMPADRLFARFTRGSSAATTSTRGSGLGLAICRAVVNAHGGTIEAHNVQEGGACVRFDLPDPKSIQRPVADSEASPA